MPINLNISGVYAFGVHAQALKKGPIYFMDPSFIYLEFEPSSGCQYRIGKGGRGISVLWSIIIVNGKGQHLLINPIGTDNGRNSKNGVKDIARPGSADVIRKFVRYHFLVDSVQFLSGNGAIHYI